ncbi:MAG: DNA polymerase IV, partial [Candidatus Bathyarchaeia archaeon]
MTSRSEGGSPVGTRVVMHLDLDYFFAQCEEKRRPELHDKPVVVCVYSGRTPDSGAVSTANYVARRMGVKSGIPIIQAKRLLEKAADAVFLPVDHDFYESMSARVMSILRHRCEKFEQGGIDEAYMEVTGRVQGDFDRAAAEAAEVKREVHEREGLICSIGIGPNKLIAKIASDFQKPDGLTVVKPEGVQSFLADMDV